MSRERIQAPTADRQAIWSALRTHARQLGGPVTVAGIRALLRGPCPAGRIRDYLAALEAAGILERLPLPADAKPGTPVRYHLKDDRGSEAPRVRTDGSPVPISGRERLWTALRVLQQASLRELLAVCADEHAGSGPVIAIATAEDYLGRLERAGLLVSFCRGRREDRVYVLSRSANTGPQAPVILNGRNRTASRVLDPNTGRIHGPQPPEGRA